MHVQCLATGAAMWPAYFLACWWEIYSYTILLLEHSGPYTSAHQNLLPPNVAYMSWKSSCTSNLGHSGVVAGGSCLRAAAAFYSCRASVAHLGPIEVLLATGIAIAPNLPRLRVVLAESLTLVSRQTGQSIQSLPAAFGNCMATVNCPATIGVLWGSNSDLAT